MGKIGEEVVTGVDKLMDLLDKRKSVSFADAAKELAVPKVVIEEWVDFLEENGIIEVEYKFTTPYISKKELTKPELEKKTKEFAGKREGFVRKVESAYKSIDLGTESIRNSKEEFEIISREIQKEAARIKTELASIEKYEQLRNNLDKDILEAQKNFKNEMAKIDKEILGRKEEYSKLAKHVKEQELSIDQEIEKAKVLPQNETILRQRIKKIEEEAKALEAQLSSSEKYAQNNQNLLKLKEMATKLEEGILYRQNALVPLLEKRKQHEQKIIETQKGLIEKLLAAKKGMGATTLRDLKQKMEQFFERKKTLEFSLNKTHADIEELKSELKKLYEEAQAIRLTSKSSKNKDYIGELEKKFAKTEQKKKMLETEMVKLSSLIKKK